MTDREGNMATLEKWSPTLFLVAGAIVVVYSSLYGAEAFLGTYPAAREFIGSVGYIIGFVGLLGLYPALTDRSPKLARAGAAFAVLGIVGFLVSIVESAGILSGEPPAWLATSELLFILAGMVLAFIAFSVANLRSDAYSRTVSLLLIAPIVVMALNLAVVMAGLASPEARFLVSGLWGLSYLAIGVTLRTEAGSTDGAESLADTAA